MAVLLGFKKVNKNIVKIKEKVPLWVFDLFCDKVECVPAGVGEESRVER